jgi:predicted alpha/beta-fold hydrolase
LFAVGYSAGSSLLGRYLGEQGEDSHIDGAVLVSPGFDMEEAILCSHLHPLADYYLTQIAKSMFLEGLEKDVTLSKRQGEAVRRLKTSRSMREFHAELHHFTGHANVEEYFAAQNPAKVLHNLARPTLFINSVDVSTHTHRHTHTHTHSSHLSFLSFPSPPYPSLNLTPTPTYTHTHTHRT